MNIFTPMAPALDAGLGNAAGTTNVTKIEFPDRVIKIGDEDKAIVTAIQLRLHELGCGPLQGTGSFGPRTEEAVKLFQARFTDVDGRPLVIDGEVGAITWAALFGPDTVPSSTTTASKLLAATLKVAASQVGVREKPMGSNSGPEVNKYLASVGLGPGNAWCIAFVYWCFEQAAKELGVANPVVKTGGVLAHWNAAGERGIPRIKTDQAVNKPSLITPGMIFVIDTPPPGGGGHAGLVEAVIGGKLTTIEGNSNDGGSREGVGVFRRKNSRKINSINKGFIDYSHF